MKHSRIYKFSKIIAVIIRAKVLMTRFNRQQSATRTPQIQFDKSKIRFHKKTDLRNVPHN